VGKSKEGRERQRGSAREKNGGKEKKKGIMLFAAKRISQDFDELWGRHACAGQRKMKGKKLGWEKGRAKEGGKSCARVGKPFVSIKTDSSTIWPRARSGAESLNKRGKEGEQGTRRDEWKLTKRERRVYGPKFDGF